MTIVEACVSERVPVTDDRLPSRAAAVDDLAEVDVRRARGLIGGVEQSGRERMDPSPVPLDGAPASARHRLPVNARARLANVERLLTAALTGHPGRDFEPGVYTLRRGELADVEAALAEVRSLIDELAP